MLELAHSERHVQQISQLAQQGGGWIDPDTFVVEASFLAASLAAGAATQAVAEVVTGRQKNALVVVRPPGHHASGDRAMGFCLFNNAAVATRAAMHGHGVRRIAIVDIDVHHGNGTQDIFYSDPDVLYCSTHQYPFYPGTGALSETGIGPGVGSTLNIPLMARCGDESYVQIAEEVLVPSLVRFEPECLLVSVGFDAHWADPLAGMQLSIDGYVEVIERLIEVANEACDGRVVLLLEGGYDLDVLKGGVTAAARLLVGAGRQPDPLGSGPGASEPSVSEILEGVRAIHGLE
jgi:acetoin utilization deacetylase AcuC-like enzyme